MIEVSIPGNKLKKLEAAVQEAGRKLPNEIAGVINKTAKAVKTNISRKIRQEIYTSAKAVNDKIDDKTNKASKSKLSAVVTLRESARISLKDFGARELKSGGVSYKVSKSEGTKKIPNAFIVEVYGGHVYTRKGKPRGPIGRKRGPSPWGVFVKRRMRKAVVSEAQVEFGKRLDARVKFLLLKASGAI